MNYLASNRCFTPFTPTPKFNGNFKFHVKRLLRMMMVVTFFMVIALEFVVEMMIL